MSDRPAHLRRQRLVRGATDRPQAMIDDHRSVILCDNDYLGLAQDSRVVEAFAQAARQYGVGAGASPLITGYTEAHAALEQALAEFTGRDRALVFGSGYLTNLGVVAALTHRHDTVLEDRLNHASLLDAVRLSQAQRVRFRHGDAEQAAQLITQHPVRLVLTDGVFSMDGDVAPIEALASAAREQGASLLCDDAHGLGVLGKHGAGLLEQTHLSQDDVPYLTATLGKALGSQGGFVASSDDRIEQLLQHARTYTYSTALAPALAVAARTALAILREEPEHRQRLHTHIALFREGARAQGLPVLPSDTAIQPIILGSAEAALEASRQLAEQGWLVRAIRPPTVPQGTARLRITLSARHETAQIEQLIEALAACCPPPTAA